MKKPMVYLSHPIRGNKENPTIEDIHRNCQMAKDIAEQLRNRMGAYNDVDLYVPGEQDEFPQTAMSMGLLDVEEVLAVDLEIISHCIAVAYTTGPDIPMSEGMKLELGHARAQDLPILRVECRPGYPCRVAETGWHIYELIPEHVLVVVHRGCPIFYTKPRETE